MMANCILCDVLLTDDNKSEEHIIPNSIGGKLKSDKLICGKCNSTIGEEIDSSIAKDLNVFANLLEIKRDRGKPQNLIGKAGNKIYEIEPGGKPILKVPNINVVESGENTQINIEARDKNQLKEILTGLKRKYPKLDVDDIVAKVNYKREYLDDFVEMNLKIGGEDTFRALVKMAYFFYTYKDNGISFPATELISFIKGESKFQNAFFYFPSHDIIEKNHKIYHSIIIKSQPKSKKLICYIELFSTLSVLILLSENYSEKYFESYIYDVEARKEVKDCKINIPNFSEEFLNKLFANRPAFYKKLQNKFQSFLTYALGQQNDKNRKNMINRAIDNSLGKYPEGTNITEEMVKELVESLMEEITPLILRKLSKEK